MAITKSPWGDHDGRGTDESTWDSWKKFFSSEFIEKQERIILMNITKECEKKKIKNYETS